MWDNIKHLKAMESIKGSIEHHKENLILLEASDSDHFETGDMKFTTDMGSAHFNAGSCQLCKDYNIGLYDCKGCPLYDYQGRKCGGHTVWGGLVGVGSLREAIKAEHKMVAELESCLSWYKIQHGIGGKTMGKKKLTEKFMAVADNGYIINNDGEESGKSLSYVAVDTKEKAVKTVEEFLENNSTDPVIYKLTPVARVTKSKATVEDI